MDIGRIPPQNIIAEQSVLGAVMQDKDILIDIQEILSPNDFYKEMHKEIYEAILSLYIERSPIDLITIENKLEQRGSIEQIGGIEYLVNIQDITPTAQNAKHYANIVLEMSKRRKLIKSGNEVKENALDMSQEIEAVIETAEKSILDVNQRKKTTIFTLGEIMQGNLDKLEERCKNKGQIQGLQTGFNILDFKLGGLQNGNLYIVAARPAMGKTAFVDNITTYTSIAKNVPTVLFSLEMTKEQITDRKISSYGTIDNTRITRGMLDDDDWIRVSRIMGRMADSPMIIDDTPSLSPNDILARCRRIKTKYGKLGLIAIDYLQLMQTARKTENRVQEISEISRSLKLLAKEINCPVICLSQLSRACEARDDKRPRLSDLRESGAIEQDADVVMFLYRDDYYNPETEKKGIAEVIVSKHRNGATGTVELIWQGEYTRFKDIVYTR